MFGRKKKPALLADVYPVFLVEPSPIEMPQATTIQEVRQLPMPFVVVIYDQEGPEPRRLRVLGDGTIEDTPFYVMDGGRRLVVRDQDIVPDDEPLSEQEAEQAFWRRFS